MIVEGLFSLGALWIAYSFGKSKQKAAVDQLEDSVQSLSAKYSSVQGKLAVSEILVKELEGQNAALHADKAALSRAGGKVKARAMRLHKELRTAQKLLDNSVSLDLLDRVEAENRLHEAVCAFLAPRREERQRQQAIEDAERSIRERERDKRFGIVENVRWAHERPREAPAQDMIERAFFEGPPMVRKLVKWTTYRYRDMAGNLVTARHDMVPTPPVGCTVVPKSLEHHHEWREVPLMKVPDQSDALVVAAMVEPLPPPQGTAVRAARAAANREERDYMAEAVKEVEDMLAERDTLADRIEAEARKVPT